jgi:REP element-mobilizing transposase RayT
MGGAGIGAYVIMPDHAHLLIRTDRLSAVMQMFKGRSAHIINDVSSRRGSLWQPGYWELGIRDEPTFWQKVEYIHFNPVKAGIVRYPEDYPWSSARQFIRKQDPGRPD